MTQGTKTHGQKTFGHKAPGKPRGRGFTELRTYLIGLGLAALLTAASFWTASTTAIYAPAIPIALAVVAVAQMGVHLVFFLHITSAPDNTNNILALAFGVLIVGLVVTGSLWIMANLNSNMMPASHLMNMQMQH